MPKKPEQDVRAISLPKSLCGTEDNRSSRYMAGMALTARMLNPPAAVAALQTSELGSRLIDQFNYLCTVQFSLGPK